MIHSIPRRHDITPDCWCNPVLISEDAVYVHWNSKNQSEDVDDGQPAADDAATQQESDVPKPGA